MPTLHIPTSIAANESVDLRSAATSPCRAVCGLLTFLTTLTHDVIDRGQERSSVVGGGRAKWLRAG